MQQFNMFDIYNYKKIEKIIQKSGKTTKIIAISKNHTPEAVDMAINQGVKIFGENLNVIQKYFLAYLIQTLNS